MALYNIPVQKGTDANSFSVELSGEVFEFNFTFNKSESKWYMSVLRNSVAVVSGQKLVNSQDLLSQYRAYNIPQGVLSIVDKDGLFADPDELNFNESVFFRYED